MAPAPGSDPPSHLDNEAGPSNSPPASTTSAPTNAHEAPKICARCGQPLPESSEVAPAGAALSHPSGSSLHAFSISLGAPSPSSIAFAPPPATRSDQRSAEQQRAFEAESIIMCAECRIAHASNVPRVPVTSVDDRSHATRADVQDDPLLIGSADDDAQIGAGSRTDPRSVPATPSRRPEMILPRNVSEANTSSENHRRWTGDSAQNQEAPASASERDRNSDHMDFYSDPLHSSASLRRDPFAATDAQARPLASAQGAADDEAREPAVVHEIIQASGPLVRARTSSFSRSLHWPTGEAASSSRWSSDSIPLVSIPHSRRETSEEQVDADKQPDGAMEAEAHANPDPATGIFLRDAESRDGGSRHMDPNPKMIDSQWRSWNHYSAIGPDPRADTSRLRMRSRGKGCLVPGATFVGTQRSGRSTYEVGVQIVNVDLEASHLCGYLNIRGLTEDWPELTTFFDAEIIGDRHSFVTNKWGAKEANDMTHWARFSPFRSLRNKLDKTGLFDHMTKPYVFMRWKERFLVPDHRVRDIHGASFAGFYYVCVELGESSTSAARASAAALAASSDVTQQDFAGFTSESDANSTQRRRGQTTLGGSAMMLDEDDEEEVEADPNFDALSRPAREPLVPGRMTGFYYHANSEPYQQLALQHVPEPSSGTFEMR